MCLWHPFGFWGERLAALVHQPCESRSCKLVSLDLAVEVSGPHVVCWETRCFQDRWEWRIWLHHAFLRDMNVEIGCRSEAPTPSGTAARRGVACSRAPKPPKTRRLSPATWQETGLRDKLGLGHTECARAYDQRKFRRSLEKKEERRQSKEGRTKNKTKKEDRMRRKEEVRSNKEPGGKGKPKQTRKKKDRREGRKIKKT